MEKTYFGLGISIIQNKNTALISNGDMGTILDFDEDEEGNPKISILFTENRMIEYELEQMEMIEHANAITVHKSQGSECPVVIIPWVKAFYVMLKRNILYTAVTRAKSKVYLVGIGTQYVRRFILMTVEREIQCLQRESVAIMTSIKAGISLRRK